MGKQQIYWCVNR